MEQSGKLSITQPVSLLFLSPLPIAQQSQIKVHYPKYPLRSSFSLRLCGEKQTERSEEIRKGRFRRGERGFLHRGSLF